MTAMLSPLALLPACLCGYGSRFAPATTNSVKDSVIAHSVNLCPVGSAHLNPEVFNDNGAPCVSGLLTASRPSTVFWKVAKVVVDSINGVIWRRPVSHVSMEVFKAIEPSIANSYSSSSVICVGVKIRVSASEFDTVPDVVHGRSTHSMSLSGYLSNLVMNASARLCISGRKGVCLNNGFFSAVANTVPSDSSATGISGSGNCCEPPVSNTGMVYCFGHFVTSKLLTVKKAWQSAVRQIFGSYPSQARSILA